MTRHPNGWTRPAWHCLVAVIWIAGSVFSGMVFASNLGFLKDAPITRFTGADLELYESTLHDALDHTADADVRRWNNPDTGSSGEIAVINSFKQNDRRCRRTRISNRARGYAEAKTDAVFCKEANGKWKLLAPSKQPPAKPANH